MHAVEAYTTGSDHALSRFMPRRHIPGIDLAPMAGRANPAYSHSMVAGGFELMSYTTRFTPGTSFTIRLLILASTS